VFVVAPPPVMGIGNAGGFRMVIEDRGGRGPQGLLDAARAMMGKAAQTPGLVQVFSLFENSTPQLYLDIDRQKAQLLGINVSDVFSALQIYLGLVLRQRLQPVRPHLPCHRAGQCRIAHDHQRRAGHPCSQHQRRHGAAWFVYDGA